MGEASGIAFRGDGQGMAISWPGHITDAGGIRTQFHHVIDIVPTILEATGIKAPDLINGIPQLPIEGVSMAYTFDPAAADQRAVETCHAILRDAGKSRDLSRWLDSGNDATSLSRLLGATTPRLTDYKWELYNSQRYPENNDLAAQSRTNSRKCRPCS